MKQDSLSSEKLIHRCSKERDLNKQWDIIRILHKRNEESTAILCLEQINSNSPKQRRIAIDILAQLKNSKTPLIPKALTTRLRTEDSSTVINAILVAFCHLPNKYGKLYLNEFLKYANSTSNPVRFGFISAVGYLNDIRAVPALIRLTQDKSTNIRDWATFTLGSEYSLKSQQITLALKRRLKDEDYETRCEAIRGLAQRKDKSVPSIILREIERGRPGTLIFEAAEFVPNREIHEALIELKKRTLKKYKKSKLNDFWLGSLASAIEACATKSNGA